ncbi:hypothetical protein M426DRAFT_319143 [Hypoxylon sp. CI-4A]|nr:hypothetical protein M426DRAFT_319143 [Hypoxylon sp. CI-4A]
METCNEFNLRIQRNAFDMLNDLRLPDEPRVIWIDAICIDQSNLEERALQVSMMNHIYERAKRVVVWLGKSDEYSSRAMTYAAGLDTPKLLKTAYQVGDSLTRTFELYSQKPYFFDLEGEAESSEHRALGIALVDFINRPWFNRVWVQQEATLCRQTTVVCGDKVVEWDAIYVLSWMLAPRFTELYPDYITEVYSQNKTLNNISAIDIIRRRRGALFDDSLRETGNVLLYPLANYLSQASRFGATDPRDKLYAAQCYAADAKDWFEVDYIVPWQILYTDVARRFIEQGVFAFLSNAGRARHEQDTILPSWAPDFRDGRYGHSIIVEHPSWMAGGPPSRFANGCPKRDVGSVQSLPKRHRKRLNLPDGLEFYKGPRKTLLQSYASVKCSMSDEIVYLGDVVDDPFDVKTTLRILNEDLAYLEKMETQTYLNDESLSDAYKLTLITSSDRRQDIVDADYVRNNWDNWVRWLEDPNSGRDNMPIWEYSMEASEAPVNFRFAITRHGYFCLVPRITRLGDVVAILKGYQLGVVVRPWQPFSTQTNGDQNGTSAPEYLELIGDSYIHGMMTNEARCIIEEFNCKHNPTRSQLDAMLKVSDSGRGEAWKTLGLHGGYERIVATLGDHHVKLV